MRRKGEGGGEERRGEERRGEERAREARRRRLCGEANVVVVWCLEGGRAAENMLEKGAGTPALLLLSVRSRFVAVVYR